MKHACMKTVASKIVNTETFVWTDDEVGSLQEFEMVRSTNSALLPTFVTVNLLTQT